MKKVVFIIFALFVAACGDNGGGSNNNNGYIATSPLDGCINGNGYCNTGIYNQYWQFGWMSYPGYQPGMNYINYFQQYGACNCPVGTRPTYNAYAGLGCVSEAYLNPFMGFNFYWQVSWGYTPYGNYSSHPINDYPVNTNQISNVSGYPTNGNCQQNLIQSCYVHQANSCGNGATCRVTAAGSGLGICVKN